MHNLKKLFPQSFKNTYHLFQAIMANIRYGFPSHKIKVIGITGTNGKTTTTQMVTKILEKSGKKVAMASTINFKIGSDQWTNITKYTTESAFAVQGMLKRAVDAGCEYFILETSSHALDQSRVWGVRYAVAVITNVTREHLDYHGTMEKYRRAKKIIFEMVAKNKGVVVVNLDMKNPQYYLGVEAGTKYGYTLGEQDIKSKIKNNNEELKIVRAEHVRMGINNSEFKIQNSKFIVDIPGAFNIENALAATCVGLSQAISLQKISEALGEIQGVPGRMEKVESGKGFDIFIDYAVTPDSLEKLYVTMTMLKQKSDTKIIAVFGACGDRDRGKRPLMGKIVSAYADRIIITNEDPYWEDPQSIIEEVASGVENKELKKDFWKILDRRDAIRKALELARVHDIVVITGKGAEESMAIKNERIPWNDKKIVLEELKMV